MQYLLLLGNVFYKNDGDCDLFPVWLLIHLEKEGKFYLTFSEESARLSDIRTKNKRKSTNKKSTVKRFFTESRRRWESTWYVNRNGFGRCQVKVYSSRSRVLTLQGSDIEAYASVSEEFIQNGWLEFSDFGRFFFLYLEPRKQWRTGSVYRFQGCRRRRAGTARYSPLMDFLQGIEEIDQGRFLIRALTVTKIERNWNLWRSEFTGYTERPSAL